MKKKYICLSIISIILIVSFFSLRLIKLDDTYFKNVIENKISKNIELLILERNSQSVDILFSCIETDDIGVASFKPNKIFENYYKLSTYAISTYDYTESIIREGDSYFIQIGGNNHNGSLSQICIDFEDSYKIIDSILSEGYFMKIYRLENDIKAVNVFIK